MEWSDGGNQKEIGGGTESQSLGQSAEHVQVVFSQLTRNSTNCLIRTPVSVLGVQVASKGLQIPRCLQPLHVCIFWFLLLFPRLFGTA